METLLSTSFSLSLRIYKSIISVMFNSFILSIRWSKHDFCCFILSHIIIFEYKNSPLLCTFVNLCVHPSIMSMYMHVYAEVKKT